MSLIKNDHYFMKSALKEARKGLGFTSPNPMVGAVIVKNNRIISKGFHEKDGLSHAEVNAINKIKDRSLLKGAVLYVNLEPCCHFGRTPPCTDLIIKSGIKKVIIANQDIDIRVAGKGIQILKNAGITVKTGILEDEGKRLNSIYFFNKLNNRPYFVLKSALSLDGRIAAANGDSKWISNDKSREIVHRLRLRIKSIAVGKNTFIKDKPSLNCRLPGFENKPVDKLIFTGSNTVPDGFFNDNTGRVFCIDRTLSSKETLIDFLNEKGIDSVLVEGGGTLNSWFLKNDLIDRIFLFYKTGFIGNDGIPVYNDKSVNSIADIKEFKINEIKKIDNNFFVDLSKDEPLCLLD